MAASADLMEELDDGAGGRFFPDGWSRYWTEHSERSTLASGLAAMGVPKSERDMLGRWQPEGSDQYVRTYSAAVGRMQENYALLVRKGNAYKNLDEGGIIEGIRQWLVTAWSVNEEAANRAVDSWKAKLERLGYITMTNMDWVDSPMEAVGHPQAPEEEAEQDEADDTTAESSEDSEQEIQRLYEGRGKGGFVVVYRRAGRGTLHRLDASGCWMARRREFLRSEVYQEFPDAMTYSVRCKLCWPEAEVPEEEHESTSDSCDELDLPDED